MTTTTETQQLSLADRITAVVEADEVQLPPLPEMMIRIQNVLASDRAGAKEVAEIVHADPAVAASLLRISNSAAFGGLQQVVDLNQAIARLGMRQVASIVTALSMKGHFACESQDKKQILQTLWDHSVCSAFASRRLAEKTEVDPEQAFLSGLLHDCGRLLVLAAVDHLEGQGALEVAPTRQILDELMEVLHCRLGARALRAWNLAEPVSEAVLHHEDATDDANVDSLLLCVQAADLVTQKLGFHLDPLPEMNLLGEPLMDRLGIGDVELAELMVDMEDELEELHKLFR